jgi:hypothetical protein
MAKRGFAGTSVWWRNMSRSFVGCLFLVGCLAAAAIAGCSGAIGDPGTSAENGIVGAGASSGSSNQIGNGSSMGTSAGSNIGSGSSSGSGSPAGSMPSSAVDAGMATGGDLPCDVQQVLATRCQSCHSSPPVGAPMALVTYADMMAPSLVDPTKNCAQTSVARMKSTTLPMPPAPATPATTTEIATLQNWITAGYPMGSCSAASGVASDGGGSADANANSYGTPLMCTSMTNWNGVNGQTMRPGEACIACHSLGRGPRFAIAGTLYPSAHEPDDCNGANTSANAATVVITDKNGTVTTLRPNSVGNFSYQGTLATPFQAKVVQGGKERIMATPQTNGDCNTCHSTPGASGAPGRIMLP